MSRRRKGYAKIKSCGSLALMVIDSCFTEVNIVLADTLLNSRYNLYSFCDFLHLHMISTYVQWSHKCSKLPCQTLSELKFMWHFAFQSTAPHLFLLMSLVIHTMEGNLDFNLMLVIWLIPCYFCFNLTKLTQQNSHGFFRIGMVMLTALTFLGLS